MRVCVFCSTQLNNQNRSREHVIPRWLQEERDLTVEVLSSGFGIEETVNIKRQMPMDSFLAGQVCKDCNNGWMSALETQAHGVLAEVLENAAAHVTLDSNEKLLLSKWTIKTAIACNSVIPEAVRIDPRFLRQFDKGRSDNVGRCGIFAGRLNLPARFGYIQTTQSNPLVLIKEDQPVTCRLVFYIDGLVLLVAFVDPDLGYTFELAESVHQPLWPLRGYEWRSERVPKFTGTLADLRAFSDALGIRYRLDL